MKKTLTVNLNNTVYHIDEDAYNELQNYLDSLGKHFEGEEGADEILSDIEARIGELFKERNRFGMQIITVREVNEIIAIMGHPEDFDNEISGIENKETPEKNNPEVPKEESDENDKEPKVKVRKRLFRDPDNQILGGVASGIGVYLGVDPVIVRILIVLLTLFFGISFWIYIILWICLPKATTAAQKLEMRGEAVTIDNIKKTVVEEMEKTNEKQSEQQTEEPFLRRLGNLFIEGIKAIFKIAFVLFGGCMGFILFIVLITLGITTIGIIFGSTHFMIYSMPYIPILTPVLGAVKYPGVLFISLLFTLGIPLFGLIRWLLRRKLHWNTIPKSTTNTLIILWLICFITAIIFSTPMFSEFFMRF